MCLFFCEAEDGIRDSSVTGVQTCALPISTLAPPVCAAASFEKFGVCSSAFCRHVASPRSWPIDRASGGQAAAGFQIREEAVDRKSTRLESSHTCNSYALLCLEKKKPPPCRNRSIRCRRCLDCNIGGRWRAPS